MKTCKCGIAAEDCEYHKTPAPKAYTPYEPSVPGVTPDDDDKDKDTDPDIMWTADCPTCGLLGLYDMPYEAAMVEMNHAVYVHGAGK